MELMPFTYHNQPVRTMQHDDGSTWWVAGDVCGVLGLSNVSKACQRLKPEERDDITFRDVTGRQQEMLIISEAGLYRLIMRSHRKEAEDFQHWVFHEVLPQIRQTGAYGQTATSVPVVQNQAIQAIIHMAVQLDRAEQLAKEAQRSADEAQAKALLAMRGQAWVTIRQYVSMHHLERQVPAHLQREYGRYLAGLCRERNIPVYYQRSQEYAEECTYWIAVIDETLPGWLGRRGGQTHLGLV
jgi:prophage antirepressor-like protein